MILTYRTLFRHVVGMERSRQSVDFLAEKLKLMCWMQKKKLETSNIIILLFI